MRDLLRSSSVQLSLHLRIHSLPLTNVPQGIYAQDDVVIVKWEKCGQSHTKSIKRFKHWPDLQKLTDGLHSTLLRLIHYNSRQARLGTIKSLTDFTKRCR